MVNVGRQVEFSIRDSGHEVCEECWDQERPGSVKVGDVLLRVGFCANKITHCLMLLMGKMRKTRDGLSKMWLTK